ncbi:MAG: galactitol-1-phosphate 5-dehydrogenase [Alkalispirochaeta sp.]|jgi:threonine dehydrogenase-like Zn-dependent dehydrogenase
MKALVLENYKNLVYKDVPDPGPVGERDLLVRVRATAICGSDVHGYDGSTGRRIPPVIMGHESAGEVAAVGPGVRNFSPGDRITFDSTVYCGECTFCREGAVNLCENRQVLGVSCDEYRRDGAFAEYLVIPERIAYRIPEGLSYPEAAVTEPMAVAAHAIRLTPLSFNDTTAVVGAGLIGLSLIQLLKASGSGTIIALDTDPDRLKVAQSFGADITLDPREESTVQKITAATDRGGAHRSGVDRVFEAVGATEPIATAIQIARKGGSVTLIGNVSPTVEIPLQSVVTRQISLIGSCAIAGEYPLVLDLMARKKVDVRPLISATAPLSEGAEWFKRLYAREAGLLKVVLEP